MILHMGVSIEWLLAMDDEALEKCAFSSHEGHSLSGAQTREALEEAKRNGTRIIILGDCNNRDDEGNCKGHERNNKDSSI